MPFGTCFSSSLAGPRVPVGRPWWAADGSRGSGGEELQRLHRALAAGTGATGGRGFTKFPSPPPSGGVSVNKEVVKGCRHGLHPEALIPEDTAQARHSSRSCPPAPRAVRGHSNHPGPPRVTVSVPPSIISAAVLGRFGDRPQWSELLFLLHFGAILVMATSVLALLYQSPPRSSLIRAGPVGHHGTASKPLGPWNSH